MRSERWRRAGRSLGDIARGAAVREAELRLQKEIEVVREAMKEIELRLQGEIELIRKEIEVWLRTIRMSGNAGG